MKAGLSAPWANGDDAYRRAPTGGEVSGGFPCGPLDLQLFNELFFRSTQIGIELNGILAAAGITPDEDVNTQLLAALDTRYMPKTPTSWRMWVSGTSVPAAATTVLGNYTQSFGQQTDSVINLTAGTITIGAEDAGDYLMAASFGSNGLTNTERVYVVYNGGVLAVSGGISPSDTSDISQSVLVCRYLNAGDVISAAFYQDNSSNAARFVDNRGGFFGLRIGDV